MTTILFSSERERLTPVGIADVITMKQTALLVVIMLAAMVPAALASVEYLVERAEPPLVPLSPDARSVLNV